MSWEPKTAEERASELRRWLDENPADAVKVIDCGLTYLVMHGVDPLAPSRDVDWGLEVGVPE